MSAPSIPILLLAAGEASRMGEPKQLLKIGTESLLRRMLRICQATPFRPIFTVLGAYAERIQAEIEDSSTIIVLNKQWQEGIGRSIAVGISAVEKFAPHAKAVLILLCDQPLVNPEILTQLVEKYQESDKAILASAYANTIGVPAVFDKRLFSELKNLNGQEGAKKIMLRHQEDVWTLPFPDGQLDLDTPEDYERFMK